MRFWIRELAGWLLVALGIYVFAICLSLLLRVPSGFVEAGPMTLIGIVLFRGGIHLLKVAMAARVCLYVHADNQDKTAARPREESARW